MSVEKARAGRQPRECPLPPVLGISQLFSSTREQYHQWVYIPPTPGNIPSSHLFSNPEIFLISARFSESAKTISLRFSLAITHLKLTDYVLVERPS